MEKPIETLRERAEKILLAKDDELEALPVADVRKLIHELEIYQVELEMQNEELRKAQSELETSRRNYYDLYDLAPVGYFTFDPAGMILEVNLTGADLLGVERAYLIGRGFSMFVAPQFQDLFHLHRRRAFEIGGRQKCTLDLIRQDGSHVSVQVESGAVQNEQGELGRCLTVITDITALKRAENSLREARDTLEERVKERTTRLQFLSSRLMAAQEEERGRIAGDLHDSIGQSMSAIKFRVESSVEMLKRGKTDEGVSVLEAVIPMVRGLVGDVRTIIRDLRPSTLDDLGIVATISWFCREFHSVYSGIRIETDIDIQENDVPAQRKTVICRVLQEAMNNLAKHSGADVVCVELRNPDGRMSFTIEDNGRGFEPGNALSEESPHRGLGLVSMKERVELSGGTFSIHSAHGAGTKIVASWTG